MLTLLNVNKLPYRDESLQFEAGLAPANLDAQAY